MHRAWRGKRGDAAQHSCGSRAKRKREHLTRTRQHLATNNAINEVQRLRTESSSGEHPPLMRSIPSPCLPSLPNATQNPSKETQSKSQQRNPTEIPESNEEDPRTLHRLPAAVICEGNEGEEEEGDVAEVEAKENDEEVEEAIIGLIVEMPKQGQIRFH